MNKYKLKHDLVIFDEGSLYLSLRREMDPRHQAADTITPSLAYVSVLAEKTESIRRIVVLGERRPDAVNREEDFEQQMAKRKLKELKRRAISGLGSGWEVLWVECTNSSQIVATLASDQDQDQTRLVVTADERMLAFLSTKVDVLIHPSLHLWTRERFQKQFGFAPRLYPVFRALMSQDTRSKTAYLSAKRAVELLMDYPNLIELINAYIEHNIVRENNLRSRIRSMSRHLQETFEDSVIRTIPKLLNLHQIMNTKIKINENEK